VGREGGGEEEGRRGKEKGEEREKGKDLGLSNSCKSKIK
jgi:hypothetical protein